LPDATGLELIAQSVRETVGESAVLATDYSHQQAMLQVAPGSIRDVVKFLRDDADEPFDRLMGLWACDYLPDEPRFGLHYELLSMERAERLRLKLRVGPDHASVPTIVDLQPSANFQEREAYDMFGIEFEGHPDLRRILMPEDYEGHPQRRDFPMGGEPVLFTFNEHKMPRWYE
jgi:NADH-quinone oxidoreductase subunit C